MITSEPLDQYLSWLDKQDQPDTPGIGWEQAEVMRREFDVSPDRCEADQVTSGPFYVLWAQSGYFITTDPNTEFSVEAGPFDDCQEALDYIDAHTIEHDTAIGDAAREEWLHTCIDCNQNTNELDDYQRCRDCHHYHMAFDLRSQEENRAYYVVKGPFNLGEVISSAIIPDDLLAGPFDSVDEARKALLSFPLL